MGHLAELGPVTPSVRPGGIRGSHASGGQAAPRNPVDGPSGVPLHGAMTYLLLFIAILAEVIATSALKAAEGFTRIGPSIIVVVGYAIAFYCLSLTLRTMPVGIAYAIWSGVGIVLVAGIGAVLYGQKLDLAAIIGLGLIIAGVLVVNLVSKSVSH